MLLTLIAHGYPGAGHWHLPGGGTDFGEEAEAGLAREIVEETGQDGEIGELLHVSHRHDVSHRPGRRSGQLREQHRRMLDWHGVRAIYAVRVPAPTTPRVIERHGSTAQARWFTPARARELPLTGVVQEALACVGDLP
jgi:ADP-ribose pyrophosphatase YjhB (NUDIX family)